MNHRRHAFRRPSPAPADVEAPTPPIPGADAEQDLRDALRRSTVDLHRRLDQAPDQRALLAPGITLEQYAAIMDKHHRALAACEAVLATLAAARPSGLPPYRPRLPALEADLAALEPSRRADAVPATEEPEPTAMVPDADAEAALGRYLGTRYVLEGATQGAAMIARRLEHHLPNLAADAFGFWRLQSEEAATWRAMAEVLATHPGRGPLASAAVAAARTAFGAFLLAFGIHAHEQNHGHVPPEPRPDPHP